MKKTLFISLFLMSQVAISQEVIIKKVENTKDKTHFLLHCEFKNNTSQEIALPLPYIDEESLVFPLVWNIEFQPTDLFTTYPPAQDMINEALVVKKEGILFCPPNASVNFTIDTGYLGVYRVRNKKVALNSITLIYTPATGFFNYLQKQEFSNVNFYPYEIKATLDNLKLK